MKAYTNIEQSKKLAEILPLETADMRYGYVAPYDFSDSMYDGGYDEVPYPKDFLLKNPNFSANEYDGELPAWSLAALLNAIPQIKIRGSKKIGYIVYYNKNIVSNRSFDIIDVCVEMILKLHEQKLL